MRNGDGWLQKARQASPRLWEVRREPVIRAEGSCADVRSAANRSSSAARRARALASISGLGLVMVVLP